MVERNPSPPREFENEQDRFRQDMVGDTSISKKWVYETVMDMCKEVKKQFEQDEVDALDIPENIQDECCKLWDLSVEKQLARFLIDLDAIKLFYGIIIGSKSPRLTEITVGLLGNMACDSEACSQITKDGNLMKTILSLLSCRDSCTLVETGRLINTCLADTDSRSTWLDFMELHLPHYYDDICFILNSSTNCDLLKNILEVLDICLESRSGVLSNFSKHGFVDALAEAGLQFCKEESSMRGLSSCLHVIYILTTDESKSVETFQNPAAVFHMVCECYEKWDCMDSFIIDKNATSVASSLSIVNFILNISALGEESKFLDEVRSDDKKNISNICRIVIKQCSKTSLNNENQNKHKEFQVSKNIDLGNEKPVKDGGTGAKHCNSSHVTADNNGDFDLNNTLSEIANDLLECLQRLKWVD